LFVILKLAKKREAYLNDSLSSATLIWQKVSQKLINMWVTSLSKFSKIFSKRSLESLPDYISNDLFFIDLKEYAKQMRIIVIVSYLES
jgi:hypothetical protein